MVEKRVRREKRADGREIESETKGDKGERHRKQVRERERERGRDRVYSNLN